MWAGFQQLICGPITSYIWVPVAKEFTLKFSVLSLLFALQFIFWQHTYLQRYLVDSSNKSWIREYMWSWARRALWFSLWWQSSKSSRRSMRTSSTYPGCRWDEVSIIIITFYWYFLGRCRWRMWRIYKTIPGFTWWLVFLLSLLLSILNQVSWHFTSPIFLWLDHPDNFIAKKSFC